MSAKQFQFVLLSAIALAAVIVAGCRGNLGRAIHEIKELEPKAKQRNEEIRTMTGVPEDKNE